MERLGAGSVVAGRYRLVEPVTSRDPGGVWRAVDRLTDTRVAVKLLAGHPADDAAARLRFRLVGRAALHLSDPGIAQVHDFGEAVLPDGLAVPYLIRELVGGQTLAERLAEGPLAASAALGIVARAAATLAVAHRAGTAHGHLVPANIVLTQEQVRLTDFGLAPLGRRPLAAESAGVLSYTAPELADGGPATPAADMYALGVVFTACLTGIGSPDGTPGAIPVSALPADLVDPDTLNPDTVDLDAVPPGLAALWAACLGPSPAERPTAAHAAVMSRQTLPRRPAAPAPPDTVPPDTVPPGTVPADTVPVRPAPADTATTPVRPVPTVTSVPVPAAAPEPVPTPAPAPAPARHPRRQAHAAAAGPRRPPRSASPRRRRLVTISQVAGATAATSGILALLMFALARQPDHPAAGDASTPARASAASASHAAGRPTRPPTPQVRSSARTTTAPPSPLTVIRHISATIHSYEQAGQIRADVGLDLDNLIQPVATDLIAGRPAPVAQLASTLRAKVATRLGENAMSRAAARALDAEITTLLGAARSVSRSSTPRR